MSKKRQADESRIQNQAGDDMDDMQFVAGDDNEVIDIQQYDDDEEVAPTDAKAKSQDKQKQKKKRKGGYSTASVRTATQEEQARFLSTVASTPAYAINCDRSALIVCPEDARTSDNLSAFPAALRLIKNSYKMKWHATESCGYGQPGVVIVTPSTERARVIFCALREAFQRKYHIMMLYARHMKQAEELKRTRVSFVVGTPHRIGTLIDDGALDLARTSLLIVDMEPNSKTVFDMNDTRQAMSSLLNKHIFKPRPKAIHVMLL